VNVVSVAQKLSTIEEQCHKTKRICFDKDVKGAKAITPKSYPGFKSQ
jgi:hypothetical protein